MALGPLVLLFSTFIAYLFTTWIYHAFFDRLSSYPGPKFFAASFLPFSYYQLSGTLPYKSLKLHDKYGPIVRISPTALSFIDDAAWADIFTKTKPQLTKDPNVGPPPPEGVRGLAFVGSDEAHARMRRNLTPGFSEKALRDQETLLMGYFDLFISKLQDRSAEGPLNIVEYLDFVTVDVIGELTFGRSFDCLTSSTLHPWMANIYKFIKAFVFVGTLMKIKPMGGLLLPLLKGVPGFKKKEQLHRGFINERLAARLAKDTPRTDFMTFVQRHTGTPTGMSMLELQETCNALMIGGTETTSTALCSAIYHLLRNPSTLQKVQDEVRSAFEKEEDINFTSTNSLKYMHLVLQEALRILPPLPSQITRITGPEGNTICNRYVPPNTSVTVSQWAASRSTTNWHLPDVFVPERWLAEPPTDFKNDKKKASQPFSLGPRNCIGVNLAWAEMRSLLAKLIWNFDWELQEESSDWATGMRIWAIYDKGPLMVKLTEVVR